VLAGLFLCGFGEEKKEALSIASGKCIATSSQMALTSPVISPIDLVRCSRDFDQELEAGFTASFNGFSAGAEFERTCWFATAAEAAPNNKDEARSFMFVVEGGDVRYQINTGWVYRDGVDADRSDHNNLMIGDD